MKLRLKKLQVFVPEDDYERIEREAEKAGVKTNVYVRMILGVSQEKEDLIKPGPEPKSR